MRTLLIDNYDSYSYNLFQLIAEANGVEPVVVANDVAGVDRLDLASFDNIVISPGPGHPARPGDFGVCAEVVRRTSVPLLGVCLGHQGIAAAEGAAVEPAPRPRHGHLTRVRHDGRDLFEGLPQRFIAVRYHSLRVPEPLPRALIATAWAEDGVVMGLRHRSRPLWGVQFHPESVRSQYGAEMLGRFRDLTAALQRAGRTPPARPPLAARSGGSPACTGTPTAPQPAADRLPLRLHARVLEFPADTQAAFDRLFAGSSHAFWLDSSRVEPGMSRFSYLGDAGGPLGEVVRYRVGEGSVAVTPSLGPPRSVPGGILDYLRTQVARRVVDAPQLPFDFACGYVGYFGYELKADCGAPAAHRSPYPDAQWIFAGRAVVVDHEEGRTYLLALEDGSGTAGAAAGAWLRTAGRALCVPPAAPVPADGPATPGLSDVEPWLVRERDRYLSDIEVVQQKLAQGESYEVCLTNAARIPATCGGLEFYRRLRRLNPAPYSAYLRFGDMHVACSSPERFLRIDRHGGVESKPIKGTAPRGGTPEQDGQWREQLAASAKAYAENLMIVDLVRNDLGRVCAVGSVHVPRLAAVETYATVHQLVSTIRGTLRPGVSSVDCVRACFPGGSMTGAPKLRTMEIIDGLEARARGVYSGSIGFLGCDGAADLNIVIRTAVLQDGEWHIGAGGAILVDSDPVEEYLEMLVKASAAAQAYPRLSPQPAGR